MPKRKLSPQVVEAQKEEPPLEQLPVLPTLAMVEPGSIFVFNGERFRLERITDQCAHVILLQRAMIKVSSDETREIEYGIARLEMPLNTPVIT